MSYEDVKKTEYGIEIPATAEDIKKALDFMWEWHCKPPYELEMHVKGDKAYILI